MDRISTVTLIGQTPSRDDIGQEIMTDNRRTVYCTVLSVSRTEWSAARQRSLDPVTALKVFSYDYHGETVAEFEGSRCEIYRTYEPGDYIELYLGKRVGEISGDT